MYVYRGGGGGAGVGTRGEEPGGGGRRKIREKEQKVGLVGCEGVACEM